MPFIGGEEEKIERESRKILGTLGPDGVTPAGFAVSAHTNRVATVDGHLVTVSVGFRKRVIARRGPGGPSRLPGEPAGRLPALVADAADRGRPEDRPAAADGWILSAGAGWP